jgi:hypothetical protein
MLSPLFCFMPGKQAKEINYLSTDRMIILTIFAKENKIRRSGQDYL